MATAINQCVWFICYAKDTFNSRGFALQQKIKENQIIENLWKSSLFFWKWAKNPFLSFCIRFSARSFSLMSNEVWRQNRNREDRTKFEENPFHNYFKRFSAADTRLITITTLIVICALLCVWNILYPTQFQAVKWQTERENGKKELQIPLKAMHKMEPTNEKRSKAKFIQVKHIVCVCVIGTVPLAGIAHSSTS